MRTILAYTLLAAVLTLSAVAGAFYAPAPAHADVTGPVSNKPPETRMPVLSIAINQINDIRDMAYSDPTALCGLWPGRSCSADIYIITQ